MMTFEEKYLEKTIYVRPKGETWEVFGRALGKGIVLENLSSREEAIKMMTFVLWAVNNFGLEHYGAQMAMLTGAPEGVEYPVVDEPEKI